MTTNPTIDGVPRELLGWALSVAYALEAGERLKQLRALLDAPEVLVVPLIGPKEWLDSLKPAAQPQGDPVKLPAKKYPNDWNKGALHSCNMEYMEGYNDAVDDVAKLGPLYAEQPSPVAVLMTGRRPIPAGIESLAQQVYQSWESLPGFVPWVEGGNSTKQDEARQIASRTFELALANQVQE